MRTFLLYTPMNQTDIWRAKFELDFRPVNQIIPSIEGIIIYVGRD